MYSYAVINQKGGVGKSTTALAIGQGLKLRGYSVLLVDLDAQGNMSYSMGAAGGGYNALGILQRPETTREEIQITPQGDLIASTPALVGADKLLTQTGKEYRLKEALATIAPLYDYCIIDTPPTLNVLTINAMTACNSLIIPTQADIYSVQGIAQLQSNIEAVKKYCNANLTITGILITRFNARSVVRREVASMLEQIAQKLNTRVFNVKIRECLALVEAQLTKQSIFTYAPRSNAKADYNALINELLEG